MDATAPSPDEVSYLLPEEDPGDRSEYEQEDVLEKIGKLGEILLVKLAPPALVEQLHRVICGFYTGRR